MIGLTTRAQAIHSKHNHDNGDFSHGLDSTSYIESLWPILKYFIKNSYTVITQEDFILFLKESEFRRNINNLNS